MSRPGIIIGIVVAIPLLFLLLRVPPSPVGPPISALSPAPTPTPDFRIKPSRFYEVLETRSDSVSQPPQVAFLLRDVLADTLATFVTSASNCDTMTNLPAKVFILIQIPSSTPGQATIRYRVRFNPYNWDTITPRTVPEPENSKPEIKDDGVWAVLDPTIHGRGSHA